MNIRLLYGLMLVVMVLDTTKIAAFQEKREEQTIFQQIISDMKKGPFAYAGLVSMGALYGTASRESKEGAGGFLIIANVIYHGLVATYWISLRAELLRLRQSRTSGSIFERKQWCGVPGYDTGYHIMTHFMNLSREEKNRLKKQLTLEMRVTSEVEAQAMIAKGLSHYEEAFNRYARNSNMLFYLARAAGFANDPQELLTSHYLVEYDFENILKDTFDQHITGSWIARSFTLRPSWSKVLGGTTLLTFYTWNYKIASECIWETLKRYSCLKAILAIFEVATVDQMHQSVNVNVYRQ